jgi:DNA invertase Pin-like site-specific DNA recombinase
MRVGYARVSTTDQDLTLQLGRLSDCDKVFGEHASGANAARPELAACLDYVREGDTLVITKMDRLARSVSHFCTIADLLGMKKVRLVVLDQNLDTETPTGRLLYHLLGAIAEFERDLIRERQWEGIQAAKRKGIYAGRKPTLPRSQAPILRRLLEHYTIQQIASAYGVHRTTIYRVLGEEHDDQTNGTLRQAAGLDAPQDPQAGTLPCSRYTHTTIHGRHARAGTHQPARQRRQ